ncbi:HDIG domain-containing metalloprotein [Herbinix luporum]|nr:HDIG domain-containing metalloprotein [Herbinix luporum]MDI9488030.1 HDIG domain-containing protein [Bacillota bacterium]
MMSKLSGTINLITFEELNKHLLEDIAPSGYFNSLDKELDIYPLNLLKKLKNVEQSKKYHPEGNVWNHTMMVVDEAAKVKDQSSHSKAFMWAALLHDIGKPDTTKVRKGRITSYDHDELGAKISKEFLEEYTNDEDFIKKVCLMVKYHMHMLYVLKGLPFGNPRQMVKDVDIHDIALLCRCDRLGRIGVDKEAEIKNYKEFLDKLKTLV